MKNKQKVIVAMSGGVDSSVSAYLLKEQGYDVVGVTFKLFLGSNESIKSAKAVCDFLNIKHKIIDIQKEFKKEIIDYFISEYKSGRTPNPCVKCNKFIKFKTLLGVAKKLNAEKVATGHYAQIAPAYKLLKGKDKTKDQSYFLYKLTQKELSKTIFPLGKEKKEKIYKIANNLKLPFYKKESQDICFIKTSAQDFLKGKIKPKKGDIVDTKGNTLREHKGIIFYTIGQRKGIGVSSKNPLYAVEINSKKNLVVVGSEKDLYKKELLAKNVNWILRKVPKSGTKLKAKIRYAMKEQEAEIFPKGNQVKVVFKKLQRAITPGQSVVFYSTSPRLRGTSSKDEVLGGGVIDKTLI